MGVVWNGAQGGEIEIVLKHEQILLIDTVGNDAVAIKTTHFDIIPMTLSFFDFPMDPLILVLPVPFFHIPFLPRG
jgi:hypothetical protein